MTVIDRDVFRDVSISLRTYVVSPDGRRFLVIKDAPNPGTAPNPPQVIVVQNGWRSGNVSDGGDLAVAVLWDQPARNPASVSGPSDAFESLVAHGHFRRQRRDSSCACAHSSPQHRTVLAGGRWIIEVTAMDASSTSKRMACANVESRAPMTKDTIFRIASMTKLVTGVAVLMMVEEGRIRLGEDRRSTLVSLYDSTPSGLRPRAERVSTSRGAFFGGAAGLQSTAEDYLRFAQMLANGGILDRQRLLSAKAVRLTASNQVGEMYSKNTERPAPGMGYGFLVGTVEDPMAAGLRVSAGSFGWAGIFGTLVWIDPREKLVMILMIQSASANNSLRRDFENAVMQSIVSR